MDEPHNPSLADNNPDQETPEYLSGELQSFFTESGAVIGHPPSQIPTSPINLPGSVNHSDDSDHSDEDINETTPLLTSTFNNPFPHENNDYGYEPISDGENQTITILGDDHPIISSFYDINNPYEADESANESECDEHQEQDESSEEDEEDEDEIEELFEVSCHCPVCYQGFVDEYALIDHHSVSHSTGLFFNPFFIDTPDQIPTYSYGEHPCPICDRLYLTNIQLNEHFALSHVSYDELCEIDQRRPLDGFPGFDLLEQIMMIEPPTPQTFKEHSECMVCYTAFAQQPINSPPDSVIDGYSSDSETFLRTELKPIPRKPDPEMQLWYQHGEKMDRYPAVFICCETPVCRRCLREMIKKTESLRCPFCRFDHEQKQRQKYDNDFIKVIEPTNRIEEQRWRGWWISNMDILIQTTLSPEEIKDLKD